MKNNTSILSTKKLLPNQKQFLLNADFSLVEADFITIHFQNDNVETTYDYLIFTSQNAVKSVLENKKSKLLLKKNCFCVGKKTKNSLIENGFQVLKSFDYAEQLAEHIITNYSKKTFAFYSGNLRRDTIPEMLLNSKIVFEEKQVYKTVLTPHKLNSSTDGILFFSPSAVESFLLKNNITNEVCFCIGKTTANEVLKTTKNIVIANQPTVENVIIQCINYFNQKSKNIL